ncbi:MAG: DUF72 domain-containing protein [Deltaproteobacteria bacterium]|nr:DUF72 domain-containing protein [Deltaproteobacteria bacterium]
MSNRIHIGTSGWTYDDWSGVFYPKGVSGPGRLSYYISKFDSVELNASFYRFPSKVAIGSWNRKLGKDFHMAVKGHRKITHFKRLKSCEDVLPAFMERISLLHAVRIVLWQLPPSLKKDLSLLEAFLELLGNEQRHAIEFRHESWWHPDTVSLLSRYRVCFVSVSHPRLPGDIVPTADTLYVRFHGLGEKPYDYDYSNRELATWAEKIRPLLNNRELYAYFNNDFRCRAVHDAMAFREMFKNTL